MNTTFWWVLLLVLGIIIGNLWLLRSNKTQDAKLKQQLAAKKQADGAATGAVLSSSSVSDSSRQRKTDATPDSEDSSDGSDSTSSGGD